MSKSKQKLPTLQELRERAERVGVDISHLGRKKKEIKALLDAEVSKLAGLALKATSTGTLDYASALNSETTQDEKAPRSTRKRKSVKGRKPSDGDSDNRWNNFFFGGDPKSKSKSKKDKKREAERKAKAKAESKRKAEIDAFLKAKRAKEKATPKPKDTVPSDPWVGHPLNPNQRKPPKKGQKVPKGMTQICNPDGYDPNQPKARPKGSVGPRMMVCGHWEWHWEKDLCRCTKCLPKRQAYSRTPNPKRR